MKKDSSTAHFDAQNYLDEEGILAWITKYGSTLLYIVVGLAAVLFAAYRFSSQESANFEVDYLNAANRYAQVQTISDPEKKLAVLEDLRAILARHPEFNANYQGNLAQLLLDQQDIAQALPLANETIRRVSEEDIALYLHYASTSLLIEQKKYSEALTAAFALKEHIQDNDLLNALNLVRIALLQQELGDRDGELSAWKEWQRYAGWKGTAPEIKTLDPKVYFVVQNYYGQGGLSLANYIESRIDAK